MKMEREKLRKEKKWEQADAIRKKMEEMGWKIEDTGHGPRAIKIKSI